MSNTNTIRLIDKPLIILIITFGFEIQSVVHGDSKKVEFVFVTTPEIKELINKWLGNQPIPISDIRAFFLAEVIFNSVVHASGSLRGIEGIRIHAPQKNSSSSD